MKSKEFEQSIGEAESLKADLSNQLEEIADRISFLSNERKSLTWSMKQGDREATTRAAKIDSELVRLRKAQEQTALQLHEGQDMLAAMNVDLRTAAIEEAQADRDRKTLATIEGWMKLYTLQQEVQEAANEVDRLRTEAKSAEEKLRVLAADKNYPVGPSFEPPIQFAEPANKLAELNRRRVELFARLGIG